MIIILINDEYISEIVYQNLIRLLDVILAFLALWRFLRISCG